MFGVTKSDKFVDPKAKRDTINRIYVYNTATIPFTKLAVEGGKTYDLTKETIGTADIYVATLAADDVSMLTTQKIVFS